MLRNLLLCCLIVIVTSWAKAQNAVAGRASGLDPAQVADLVVADHILANEGVLDAWGHVSVRDAHDPKHFLMSRAVPPALVIAADIIEYDADANPVSDPKAVGYLERFLHAEIYKARPDVMAVVHSHAPDVIPFTVTNVPLRPMIHMAGFMPQVVPVFEIRDTAGPGTDLLIRSKERGDALAKVLGEKSMVLLRGHGAVVVAPTLHAVVGRSFYMAVNARTEMQALELGKGNVVYLTPEEAALSADQAGFERGWEYWKAKVTGGIAPGEGKR